MVEYLPQALLLDWNFQPRYKLFKKGYVNPANTTLSFDVTMVYGNITAADKNAQIRFQNNV
jgi:hypothetical protein